MTLIIRKLDKKVVLDDYKRHKLLYSLPFRLNKRLTLINQKSPAQNLWTSLILMLIMTALGAFYFLFSYSTFRGLWYHKLLCAFSALIFTYLCEETYFELYEKRIRMDLPSTLKKLTHYYNLYKGNIVPALEDTISKCPVSNRVFIVKMREALGKTDYVRQIGVLENQMPTVWMKMLCRIVLFAKENGGAAAGEAQKIRKEDVIASSLKRLTNIATFLNIEQGYNDAELLGMQIFVFFTPFMVIPVTRWYNTSLLIDFDMGGIYNSVQAQSLTAVMLFISSFGALFIHWMRKLQS
ncbi:MAG TPA: hypothetical protein VD757_01955 [Candidatus Nitrosocosmicus sp.]|nr:hypothetical protein [Candidatus Nitrosocosmicus sp.]